jgi:uncharacterized protein (DUF427 family)
MTQTRSDAHRLEIDEGNEHVRIVLDGVELADSRRPVLLREGSLPTRYYLPRDDVRMERLTPTDTSTHCPFKGDASYWSAAGAPDIAWTYGTPVPGAERITGLVCFFNEKVDVEVDGVVLERPKTPWS